MDCVVTENTTVQAWKEPKAHFLHLRHVEKEDRVVIFFQMLVCFYCAFWIRVQIVHECEVNALCSLILWSGSPSTSPHCLMLSSYWGFFN